MIDLQEWFDSANRAMVKSANAQDWMRGFLLAHTQALNGLLMALKDQPDVAKHVKESLEAGLRKENSGEGLAGYKLAYDIFRLKLQ